MRSLVLLLLVAAPALSAQPVFDLDRLDSLFDRAPKVEVNLRGGLLGLAAAATSDSEPELSEVIRSLDAITVRIYPIAAARNDLSRSLTGMLDRFEDDGWYTMVRVRSDPDDRARALAEGDEPDDDEDVWVYVRDESDVFGGLVVVALNRTDGDATFVHIDGLISADEIGRLTTRFGDVDVSVGSDGEAQDD